MDNTNLYTEHVKFTTIPSRRNRRTLTMDIQHFHTSRVQGRKRDTDSRQKDCVGNARDRENERRRENTHLHTWCSKVTSHKARGESCCGECTCKELQTHAGDEAVRITGTTSEDEAGETQTQAKKKMMRLICREIELCKRDTTVHQKGVEHVLRFSSAKHEGLSQDAVTSCRARLF